jgi:hypothetical protein
MNYYQEGGAQPQVDPQQLEQMFAALPPEVQAEIKKLPQEQQAQVIVAAYQKMQEMLAQQGGGQEQAPQGPSMAAPTMAQGGFNFGMENSMNQHMNGVIRMQEGGAMPNPSSDRMAQLAQAAPAGAQMPQQGQPQMDPEQLKQMFAQLPPEVQQQIQQMPPEQQPQAIMQAYEQMQQQGGQAQQAPEMEAPQMAYGGANMFSQEVAPESIYKMAKGGYLHDGYMFNSFNTPHPLKGDSEYNQIALMKCGGKTSLVKFGKRKMQTGGPTMDKSGSTYKRGDSIKGPGTYIKRTEADFKQDSTLQDMNRGRHNVKVITRKMTGTGKS